MGTMYAETVSLCPECAADSPSYYEERRDGMYLHLECAVHGHTEEKVENDPAFFRWMYEREYCHREGHLLVPVTYRCNLNCRYCYTLSNAELEYPPDRKLDRIVEYCTGFGTSSNLIGGEPTVREDLPNIISGIKAVDGRHLVSVSTNGQRLKDLSYVYMLKERGLDYVFLSLNDIAYEQAPSVYSNKVAALENCLKAGMPVWLQRTVESLDQLDTLMDFIWNNRKAIFQITIRSVKPFGKYHPEGEVYVSDMIRHLGLEVDLSPGNTPFNCYVSIAGRKTKLCSWVNDFGRLDPIDYGYIIANDELTTFHRGMRQDEVLIKTGGWKQA